MGTDAAPKRRRNFLLAAAALSTSQAVACSSGEPHFVAAGSGVGMLMSDAAADDANESFDAFVGARGGAFDAGDAGAQDSAPNDAGCEAPPCDSGTCISPCYDAAVIADAATSDGADE